MKARKPDFLAYMYEQQKHRHACASTQSDQRLMKHTCTYNKSPDKHVHPRSLIIALCSIHVRTTKAQASMCIRAVRSAPYVAYMYEQQKPRQVCASAQSDQRLMQYTCTYNKSPDKYVHPRSLISALCSIHVRTTKAQTSMCIRAVRSAPYVAYMYVQQKPRQACASAQSDQRLM